MEEDFEIKGEVHEEDFSDGIAEGSDDNLTIQEFINRKRLQNRILGEIIEKIKTEEIGNKLPDQSDIKSSK